MELNRIWRGGFIAAGALLALALVGCSSLYDTVPTYHMQSITGEQRSLTLDGLLPDWDLEDMVERSDAIAIGVLETDLGTKQEAGGLNDPPSYYYEFTDYKFEIERDFYPGTLPANIAVMAETGVASGEEGLEVFGFDGVPNYELDNRVLLFLESMADDERFGDGASRPVPEGFTKDDYYLVMVGGPFGKLIRNDEKWEDSRTADSFTTQELTSAVEEIKKTPTTNSRCQSAVARHHCVQYPEGGVRLHWSTSLYGLTR